MKTKSVIVTFSELFKNNKRLCLSTKRALGRCFECPNYGGRYRLVREDKKLWMKPCESRIENPEYNHLQEQKARLYAKIKEINEKIKEVK